MKNRLTQFIPSILAIIGLALQEFGLRCFDTASCPFEHQVSLIAFTVLTPLYWFCLIVIFPLLIIALVPKDIFKYWLRFAIPSFILSVLIIAITPTTNGGLFPLYRFVTEDAAKLTGGIFAIGTLVIIIWKSWGLRKEK